MRYEDLWIFLAFFFSKQTIGRHILLSYNSVPFVFSLSIPVVIIYRIWWRWFSMNKKNFKNVRCFCRNIAEWIHKTKQQEIENEPVDLANLIKIMKKK